MEAGLDYGKVIGIARAFAEDFALCYNMPELKEASKLDWSVHKKREDSIRCEAEVQPKGQISALVSSLHVQVSFYQNGEGLYYATVRLSYQHHSGGSNGHTDEYRVVTKKDIMGRTISYVGFIHHSLEYAAMMEEDEALKHVKA